MTNEPEEQGTNSEDDGMSEQEKAAMQQWLEDPKSGKGKPDEDSDMESRLAALERGDQLRAGKDITVEGNQISFKGRSGQDGAAGADGGTLDAPVQPAVVFNNGILVTANFYIRPTPP